MDSFLLSFHSISVFTVLILTGIILSFLLLKQDKPNSSRWLIGVFLGYFFLYLGHFLAYSFFIPIAAYHHYFTLSVMYGISCLLAFSYYYPKNDFNREARIVVPTAFIIATLGLLYFSVQAFGQQKFYNFSEHHYSFNYGVSTSLITFFLHVWCFIVLIRKTIFYSEYDGFLSKWQKDSTGKEKLVNETQGHTPATNVLIIFAKYWNPQGKDAITIKNFARASSFLIVVSIANFLSKAEFISHELYAYILSALSLLLSFYLVATYFNHADVSTSFLVKIVGISLITLLIALGYVGHIILSMSENDYDSIRLSEINNSKKNIIEGNYEDISGKIKYILRKPLNSPTDPNSSELLYSQDYLSHKQILKYQTQEREKQITRISQKLKRKHEKISKKELTILANDELNRQGYQLGKRLYRNVGSFYTYYHFEDDNYLYEVGYSYLEYRQYTHSNLKKLFYAIILMTTGVLILFPRFLKKNLVTPLDKLLLGVKKVNEGNLDVLVPVGYHDEIGSLANSFNTMVLSLKDMREKMQSHADSLEEKIKQRAEEIQNKAEEIQQIKKQQQGDYFLTSLLAKPLIKNGNDSEFIKTDFFIKQKNQFQFGDKAAEFGGDLCITGNLRFGHHKQYSNCIFAMNADAGNQSFHGAGGALILGVVVNSILSRSAASRKILEYTTPRRWLQDCFEELNRVFLAFNGNLQASASFILVEESGKGYFINAGHPPAILYRKGQASYLEKDNNETSKLGDLKEKKDVHLQTFQIKEKDCIFIGSDGKDKILSEAVNGNQEKKHKQPKILQLVESTEGKLLKLRKELLAKKYLHDDISLLVLDFQKTPEVKISKESIYFGDSDIDKKLKLEESSIEDYIITTIENENKTVSDLYLEGRKNYLDGKIQKALEILSSAYQKNDKNQKLNKLYGLVCFKGKEYETAIRILNHYLSQDPDNQEMWYYLSLAQRKIGNYLQSIESAKTFHKFNPKNVQNLINLSDLYRLNGNYEEARKYTNMALKLDPENKNIKKLIKALENVA